MAAFKHFQNMYDISLKPRLLRSLIRDHLPDEKHPFPRPSELSIVVSAIKTHGLLFESCREPVDPKQVDNWKTAIDAWVERLLLLASSKMPDKCWAGICLLGLTCQDCSSDRFLASYSVWFQKLVAQIQPPSASHFVKVASCASLADLFTRLGGFSNLKKDGTSHAGKLIQPILELLSDDSSEAVWEGAVDLLRSILIYFPASVHRHYDTVEAIIVSRIMSEKCSATISKFVYCLALLPKSKGDEVSWSLMMQKILISINAHLDDAFQGLEEETKSNEVIRHLVPPGKEPPPPLGGQPMSGEASNQATKASEQFILHRVSLLVCSCCTMLTNPYTIQVTIPVRPLLALVRRVLMVDGSLSQALLPFFTVIQQESICSDLPLLHLCTLDLLTAIIKGVRSQLLPHAADVVRLLTEYFRRCALPALRIKVYSIMRVLLISMGVGMALYLAQEVTNNAIIDLDFIAYGWGRASYNPNSKATTEALHQPSHRKRKHSTITASFQVQQSGVGREVETVKNKQVTPIAVQIAALQALEALLTVGGALRSESWRSNLDLLLITVATNAYDGEWANEEKGISVLSFEPNCTWAEFQLAALRALLASFLSPSRVRPRYLSDGLELFRRGKQEIGTKLAEFCAHALLALEVLIHPRSLPLVDISSRSQGEFVSSFDHRLPENLFSVSQKNNNCTFPGDILVMDDPELDDDLYSSWLGNGEETDVPMSVPDKQLRSAQELCGKDVWQATGDCLAEKILSDSTGALFLMEGDGGATGAAHMEIGGNGNVIMTESEQVQEIVRNNDVEAQDKDIVISTGSFTLIEGKPKKGKAESNRIYASKVATTISSFSVVNGMDSSDPVAAAATAKSTPAQGGLITTLISEKGRGLSLEYNTDASMDSFPDIVDGDPDSD
ncbi:PREDICTED: proline-, glutamic acid- and leucine-rich protein 1-like isoform X2 [Nelumbo nucifera]|uniref:Proline-, glutamic acid- and leucine-rich protein 1-like isoform X2 n=1 Tax=Nelumbo nucifera TaxID=4432 RepID=A0A1U8A5D3_NELNU|nr:PREDICTED: proline-, glutamic acid- and leucine-rich protein 1-like isoform X2 [Nelumbo nucifera]